MNQFSTKEKIILKSLEMFNDQGVENITTRHIASELGMSQGNLHYHYPNKNEILKVLFKNFLMELKEAEEFDGKEFTHQLMFKSMSNNFRIMEEYRLFFQQNEVIWRRVPQIKIDLISLLNRKKEEIIQIISLFKKEGKFRPNISADQVNSLAEQFIFTISSWLTAKNYSVSRNSSDYYSKFLFRLWLPYLHEDEMKKWEKHLKKN